MWSMPDKVLRVVAAGILCSAVLGFVMGLAGAGPRARLPGEQINTSSGSGSSATDALPINLDALPPVPKGDEEEELTEEEKAEAEKKAEEEKKAAEAKKAAAEKEKAARFAEAEKSAKAAEPATSAPPPPEPAEPPPAKEEPLY